MQIVFTDQFAPAVPHAVTPDQILSILQLPGRDAGGDDPARAGPAARGGRDQTARAVIDLKLKAADRAARSAAFSFRSMTARAVWSRPPRAAGPARAGSSPPASRPGNCRMESIWSGVTACGTAGANWSVNTICMCAGFESPEKTGT